MVAYIYALHCPVAKCVRYIGKAQNPAVRFRAHLTNALSGALSHHCARWIRGLLNAGLRPTLEVIHACTDDEPWQDVEKRLIAEYRQRGCALTNLTSGGEGVDGLSPDAIERRSRKTALAMASAWKDPAKRARFIKGMTAPEAIDRRAKATQKRMNDPLIKVAHSAKMKKVCATSEWFTAQSARSKKLHSDPVFSAKRTASLVAAYSTPEMKAKMSAVNTEIGARPEVKAKRSATHKRIWADPVLSAKRRASLSSDETRQKMSAKHAMAWADPVIGAALRALHSSVAVRQKKSESAKRRATPEYRAMMAEKTRASWLKRKAVA